MSAALALVYWALLTQAPGPPALSLPGGFVVHVQVSERLDPDRLPVLARPETVLWVETRSNTLPNAWVERLASFREAYVQMRLPLRAADLTQLRSAPGVGVWLSGEEAVEGCKRLGTRPCAVGLEGELTEARWQQAASARARRVVWRPAAQGLSLGEWSLWRQLPGRSGVEGPSGLPEARAVVSPEVDDDALRQLFITRPDAQLEVDVGASFELAVATGRLLRRLEGTDPGR